MKRLTFVIGIALTQIIGYGQELPKSNQKVLDFVEGHMFEKVGDGVCGTLVEKALRFVDKKYRKIHTGYGKRVELGDALPGDIIKFSGCVFEKTFSDGSIVMSKASSHVGIVYSVDSDTTITIADQNNGGNGDGKKNRGDVAYEDSHVNTSEINLTTLKKGKILIYRPY